MKIANLYVICVFAVPTKAHAVLIVNVDLLRTLTVALQLLEVVPGRNTQLVETVDDIDLIEFPESSLRIRR